MSAPASAVTSFGVVVKAGSRFEGHDNLGVGHAIRYIKTLRSPGHALARMCLIYREGWLILIKRERCLLLDVRYGELIGFWGF